MPRWPWEFACFCASRVVVHALGVPCPSLPRTPVPSPLQRLRTSTAEGRAQRTWVPGPAPARLGTEQTVALRLLFARCRAFDAPSGRVTMVNVRRMAAQRLHRVRTTNIVLR